MHDITLAILAGGAGSRMGGPKANLTVHGRPILQYLLERLDWPGPTMLVTAPGVEHPAGAEFFGREVCDPVAGLGPLRGILTALENATSECVVIATVDMPLLTSRQCAWIAEQLNIDSAKLGVMISRRDGASDSIEPFPSAYRRSAITTIKSQLAQHRRSVHGLLTSPGFAAVEAPTDWPASTWTNLNTPSDLQSFQNAEPQMNTDERS